MITAAVVSSLRVSRIRPVGFSYISVGSFLDLRHHRHARLEAGHAERQLRKDEERHADHGERRGVFGRHRVGPVADLDRVAEHLPGGDGQNDDVEGEIGGHERHRDPDGLP